ncbi:MAG: TraR/DksA C4-type zinc finger protein [Planctomycetaceae bacterium]|nr:TraR/DksA C4-type zinc finger protein [Planctomycetaceae bacterium]
MAVSTRPCKRCRQEIPVERIEALPETQLCLRCSEAVGSDFEVFAVAEKTSKVGSLKKNYGSWTVQKRRREIVPLEDEGC